MDFKIHGKMITRKSGGTSLEPDRDLAKQLKTNIKLNRHNAGSPLIIGFRVSSIIVHGLNSCMD